MKKYRLKKGVSTKIILFILIIIFIVLVNFYKSNLKAVSKKSVEVEFTVNSGDNYYSILDDLKVSGLIKNKNVVKLYLKLSRPSGLQAGTYMLNKNMNVKEIINTLSNKSNNSYSITFKEGKNMRSIASVIAKNTNNTLEDVYNLLNDKTYLNSLITNYWFIDDKILDSNIYYSLEGYLYPNTYRYTSKNVTVKEIFKSMLDEMDKKLSTYKSELLNSKYSIHEIITIASVIELEGKSLEDRKGIASVFYNRLNMNMNLGSDVTTYYAAKVDMGERDLYANEINDNNLYNTRSSYLNGKLPIGPICNPGIESINASLNPSTTNYYYFVADKNGKVYFANTYNEHMKNRDNLIEAGLWYNYE